MSAAGRAYSFGMAPGSTIVPPCWWRDDISQGTCGRKNCVTALTRDSEVSVPPSVMIMGAASAAEKGLRTRGFLGRYTELVEV